MYSLEVLNKALLISSHNIRLQGEIKKKKCGYPSYLELCFVVFPFIFLKKNIPYTEFITTVNQHMHTVGSNDTNQKNYNKRHLKYEIPVSSRLKFK